MQKRDHTPRSYTYNHIEDLPCRQHIAFSVYRPPCKRDGSPYVGRIAYVERPLAWTKGNQCITLTW